MTFDKITEILAEQLDADRDAMTADTKIADDLGADSLDLVDLIMAVEDEFDIEIPDEDVENIQTIGDIVNYIDEKIK